MQAAADEATVAPKPGSVDAACGPQVGARSPACCGPHGVLPPPPQPCRFQDGTRPDLLATTGDFLRLWRVSDEPGSAQQGVRLEKLLNNVGWRGMLRCAVLRWAGCAVHAAEHAAGKRL